MMLETARSPVREALEEMTRECAHLRQEDYQATRHWLRSYAAAVLQRREKRAATVGEETALWLLIDLWMSSK